MSRSNRLLWLLPKWPLPAQDGARVANVNLMKGLVSLGQVIDVVCVAGDNEACGPEQIAELRRECGVADCYIVRRRATGARTSWRGALEALRLMMTRPWLAVTLLPFSPARIRKEISRLLSRGPSSGGSWDALVYDGLHTSAHSLGRFGRYRRSPQVGLVVYRAHNVEAEIWSRKTALVAAGPMRWFFRLQTALMKRFENSVVEQADAVMTVSENDLEIFKARVPSLKGITVPIGYDFGQGASPACESEGLLYLGRLDWPPNREGLAWFLEEVWPKAHELRPSLRLRIAGSGNAGWLKPYLSLPGVEFLGRVDQVSEAYRQNLLSLVPVFYGSGTRVKAIEASRYARACLSTAVGVEGLGLEAGTTYIRAESAEEWILALARLDPAQIAEIGRRAYERLKSSFHLPIAAGRFLTGLSEKIL